MGTLFSRIIRRSRAQLAQLRLGVTDRLERNKTLMIERVAAGGQSALVSLIWSSPHFPHHLLADADGRPLETQDQGRARLGRATGGRYRHYFWLAAPQGVLAVTRFAGRIMQPCLKNGRWLPRSPLVLDEVETLARPSRPARLPAALRPLRAAIETKAAKDRFAGAWVMIDRAERADDNAEHFYRFLQKTGVSESCYFVLDRASPDWDRLDAEGFRLLAFGSEDHIAAVAHAAIVASSQASVPVFWPAPKEVLQDLVSYRFVFLQHGVIINDLSSWLNQLPIDLFITTTPQEFAAISSPDSVYRYSARDTVLAGLARHDALLARPRSARWLTVAPTWRNWLTGQIDPRSMARSHKRGFAQSDYARAWSALLSDADLRAAARANSLEILLLPHPNLLAYFPDLALPPDVVLYEPQRHGTYQDVIAATACCLTDYSSLTMDMAVLDIPQVYYQFDADDVLGGRHLSGPGYFDYTRDGFGPVVTTKEAVLEALHTLLEQGEDPIYPKRRQSTLLHRDGLCSARTLSAIQNMLGSTASGGDF